VCRLNVRAVPDLNRATSLVAACLSLLIAAVGCQDGAGNKAKAAPGTVTSGTKSDQPRAKPRAKGIEGRVAPAWGVSKWFNLADGDKLPEITNYRGKVVYLFFFQSW